MNTLLAGPPTGREKFLRLYSDNHYQKVPWCIQTAIAKVFDITVLHWFGRKTLRAAGIEAASYIFMPVIMPDIFPAQFLTP
jgi:hypothetical protein